MKTAFLTFLCIGCFIVSPLLILSLSIRSTPVTPAAIKGELLKLHLYDSAVEQLDAQLEAALKEAAPGDPVRTIVPFMKAEIMPSFLQMKAEGLIDDMGVWLAGKGTPPVLSFSDLKDKLVRQNRNILDQIESAADEAAAMQKTASEQAPENGYGTNTNETPAFSAGDIRKFVESDFTIPVGQYLSGLKFMVDAAWYMLLISGGIIGLNLLLIAVVAGTLQAKLRWLGVTLLLTAIWNIPGILIGVGSSVMIASILTQSVHGVAATIAKPFVETIITPVILTYTRISGGMVIALFILSTGMIVLSFFAKTSEIVVPVSVREKKSLSKNNAPHQR